MADALTKFLVDLALDPHVQAQYAGDPQGTMTRAGLSDAECAAMLTRDTSRVRAIMGHGPAHHMTQQGGQGGKKGAKKKSAKKAAKRKGAKKKGGRKS